MFAKLVCFGSLCPREEIAIERFPFVFGRAADVSLRLDDRWVSRYHCQIEAVDGVLRIRDLGSTHGTLLNNCPVGEATLQDGDRLTIGLTSFRVCATAGENPSSVARYDLVPGSFSTAS